MHHASTGNMSTASRSARVAMLCAAIVCAVAFTVSCSDDNNGGGSEIQFGDFVAGDCIAGVDAAATPGAGQPDLERVECDGGTAQFRVRQLVVVETAGDDYPGSEFLQNFAATTCGEDTPTPLAPTRQQWLSGERYIVCLSEP